MSLKFEKSWSPPALNMATRMLAELADHMTAGDGDVSQQTMVKKPKQTTKQKKKQKTKQKTKTKKKRKPATSPSSSSSSSSASSSSSSSASFHASLTALPADSLNDIVLMLGSDASDLYHVECTSRFFHQPTQRCVNASGDVVYYVSIVHRALRLLAAAAGRPAQPLDLPRSSHGGPAGFASWTHLLLWQLAQGLFRKQEDEQQRHHDDDGRGSSSGAMSVVAAGDYHSLFVAADGSVYACGGASPDDDGQCGQLGLGPLETIVDDGGGHHRHWLPFRKVVVPRRIPTFGGAGQRKVRAVSASSGHSLFLTDDGAVYSSGHAVACGLGGLGGWNSSEVYRPRRIKRPFAAEGKRVVAIAAGQLHSSL